MMRNFLLILICLSAASFQLASSNSTCKRQLTFLPDLNSHCQLSPPPSSPPIEIDGESFERALDLSRKNEYTAVLFYASWCPFSIILKAKFFILSSMYPRIKHLMVEQSSAMPSLFSRYGIHSVPSLLILNQTTRTRYYGGKNLVSLEDFYRRTTGLDREVEDESNVTKIDTKSSSLWSGASFKEKFLHEPYLVLSIVFLLLRASQLLLPIIVSHLVSIWVTYISHPNLGIFGESRQLSERLLHLIDGERIWNKIKHYKARNFREGARNAKVWASSLATVSLGEASSSRVFPSRDL